MDERCAEVEDLEERDQQNVYRRVKELVAKKNHNKIIAKKKVDGNAAKEMEEVKARRNEYVAELYIKYNDGRPDIKHQT